MLFHEIEMYRGAADYFKTEIPCLVPIGSDLQGCLRHDPALEIRLRNVPFIIGEKNPGGLVQKIQDLSRRHVW